MASRNAWPFFLFWLNWPEVGFESEPKKLYGSPQMIGIRLSCICRTVSSCWSSASLASSSVILELACTNFSSAFWWWSHSMEAFFSAILMLLVRLLWQSLFHLTFLSDRGCDASSSIWQTMFSHAIWKAFQPPWAVFLPLAPLTLLQHAKHMLCTYHIPHNVLWW